MNTVALNDLVRTVLQKNSLLECSVQDLKNITKQYPYFTIGQLLLAEKLKENGNAEYTDQIQKLSLYIQDPLWLEQVLDNKGELTLHAGRPQAIEQSQEIIVAQELLSRKEDEQVVDEVLPKVVMENTNPNIEPVKAVESEITFEPYYTVDYFASQGIRMKEEEQPADKLGQQLRSFTEWLKTLKRLPVAEITVNVDRKTEQKVDQMAEHSIEDREIVTEAMAEVWEKQGNADKAIATYRKLSLLNPSKSSYFAAKIDHLKTS